jgi:hypothetical protein
LAALFSLVAGAFTSRLHRWGPFWAGGLFLAFLFVGVSLWFGIVPVILLGGLATHVGSFAGGVRGDRRWTAWAGTGPGMFLGAALLVQGLLSSFAVLGAGDWLNGKNSASSLIDGCKFGCPSPNTPLQVPMPYVLIGTAALLGLVFLVVVIAGMLFRSRKAAIGPAPVHDYVDDVDDVDAVAAAHVEATLLGGRRLAARAHRAEKTVAFLVLSGLTTMLVVLLYAVNGSVPWHPEDAKASFVRRLTDLGTAGVSFLALALLAAVVGGAAGKRPLGLIWDLICFLPRAAHPFGPPCYAERAVPELSSRVEWWLDKRPVPSYGHRRRGEKVVLSAHSLGGVLAVATLLARLPRGGWPHHEVRLLTYGSQLRAYFSRIFPELLGPTVLGTPPARAAQFWAPDDPWSVDANDADRPPPFDPPRSIVAILTTDPSEPSILRPPPGSPEPDDAADDTDVRTPTILWRNLWRRTDYLGMPVWSYRPDGNPIDHGAEEIDHTGYLVEVKTHGDYPRSAAYQEALIELAD